MKGTTLPTVNVSKACVAEANRVLQYGCKDRLKITCRSAYYLKYLRGRCLLVQRRVPLLNKLLNVSDFAYP